MTANGVLTGCAEHKIPTGLMTGQQTKLSSLLIPGISWQEEIIGR
jgi:hypothetical protein